ncbi:hypothetical protein HYH03_015342 [Edaphochlamys debaryana]|uniref:TFIIS central domain-containing protein n=1 Tax=Edaphochlamys debaryana TaxID=47281 RepID=A0A835XJI0_9CHLO|nr:hypothetical protein HYH03_015342 [Edaphochlamys debaryana]|eukprot:KAG2485897.1 hypothetical protein HYH03_015342 [Edaphochlamys debaryana]
MATRERRVSRPPAKFADEDVYWEPKRGHNRPLRQVYRLLKAKDLRKDLEGQEVHVYWPEDQQWYKATVEEVNIQSSERTAYLHYPDTDEYEDIDLDEAIDSSQIAVIETRSIFAKLRRGEIPVSAEDRATAVYEDEDGGGDDPNTEPSGSEEDEELEEDDEPRKSREHHKQVQRPKRAREASDRPVSAKKHAPGQGAHVEAAGVLNNGSAPANGGAGAGGALGAAADSDMAEAEAFKNSLISALMHTIGGQAPEPSAMIPTPGGSGAPMLMIPTPGGPPGPGSARGDRGLRQQASLPSAGSTGGDEEVRVKVREQLVQSLQKAADELQAEGYTEALPSAVAVAAEVEAELYKLHGSSVSRDYKARFRSLAFNLKDAGNPELRARVLRGELAPGVLVTLGPAELARKELSEWRRKREEEAAKAVFLDAETAAKFSTAAAAALAQSRLRGKDEEAAAAGKPAATPERAGPGAGAEHAGASGEAGAGEEGAPAEAGGKEGAGARPLGLARHDSVTTSLSLGGGGGAGRGGLEAPDLVRRTSVTSGLPPAPAAEALPPAPAAAPSAQRTVLRAALPAAPLPGDETPPREDADGDAPYDPAAYDPDEPYDPEREQPPPDTPPADMAEGEAAGSTPPYDPIGPSSAPPPPSAARGAPSLAALRAATASASLPPGPGPSERQPSLPSPVRSPPAAPVLDLAPVVARQEGGEEGPLGALPLDSVGDPLWSGVLRVPCPSGESLVAVEASYLGGAGRLGPMLRSGASLTDLVVKGQVKLSRVEQFFEELRRSRSRTISLALLRPLAPHEAEARGLAEAAEAGAAAGAPGAAMAEFIASHRSRAGLATPQPALEAYLVTRGQLAARLLKTARGVCPHHQLPLLPEDLGEGEVLLALVHPRAWEPPPHALHPPPAQSMHPPPSHMGYGPGGLQPPYAPAGDPGLGLPGGVLGAPTADPRRRTAGEPAPPPAEAAPGPGGPVPPPIDLGALSDLAAALGIAGQAPGAAPAAGEAPPSAPAPDASGSSGGGSTQLVTVVMQNPDGSLAIVAVPQGQQPGGAGGQLQQQQPMGGPPGGPPPAYPTQQGPPPSHPHAGPPPPHGHEHPPSGPPPPYRPPPGPGGPYGEPPPDHRYGPPPPGPGRYDHAPPGPHPPHGGPPPPYGEPRGPPPPHGPYPPQGPGRPDPYYGGPPPPGPGGPPPHHPHHPPPGPGGPPPPYPPDGRGPPPGPGPYPPPDYYRGGPPPPGPHDPYRGGPPPPGRDWEWDGRGPPPPGRGWAPEPPGGRWSDPRGGPGPGRGGEYGGGYGDRGPPYDDRDDRGGRGGYGGGRGGRDWERDRGGRDRRDRDRDRGYGPR